MSVESPVLERKVDGEEEVEVRREAYASSFMTDEEKHNSRISANYAKLINPEMTVKDIIVKEHAEVRRAEERGYASPREIITEKPYLVENARADSDLFRADSAINKRVARVTVAAEDAGEEENEDLRPTQTTIQYRTLGVKKTVEEGKIVNTAATRKARLSKRDKIIIAAVVAAIVALFVLIIVNSAIISGINGDISQLQTALPEAANNYAQALAQKEEYLNEVNLYQAVSEFAAGNGMVLK